MKGKASKAGLLLLVLMVVVAGACEKSGPTSGPTIAPTPEPKEITSVKPTMASYQTEVISVTPRVPSYPLPLAVDAVVNLEAVSARLKLTQQQKELLARNGFVVTPWFWDNIVTAYPLAKMSAGPDTPMFITTDTFLHVYHVLFNDLLKSVEEGYLVDDLTDLSAAMLERSVADYQAAGEPRMKEAARRNVAYFAVASTLLQGDGSVLGKAPATTQTKSLELVVPPYVKTEVEEEIGNIEAHRGFAVSALFNSNGDPPVYMEDYSQYAPRGHYTKSETLKRYFKAMMWYGRMAFLLKGGDDAIVKEEDADIATIQASLIAHGMPGVTVGDRTAREVWERAYQVTSFFVGLADDLTPIEYVDAIHSVFGQDFQPSRLSRESDLLDLKLALARMRNPEIYGGSGVITIGPPASADKLNETLSKTKGMRFMGQKFVPDSYMFQHLVYPSIGRYLGTGSPFTMKLTAAGRVRTFVRGLDVMAVLGSERAYELLQEEGDTEYDGYDDEMLRLQREFSFVSTDGWNRNLYWSWLYALKPLLTESGVGYPTFMQTKAWQDKQLSTALASWAELRHDTLLYAKQSYAGGGSSRPVKPLPDYVEPVPELYSRLRSLTRMTRDGLERLGALSDVQRERLNKLEGMLGRMADISVAELEDRELGEEDYAYIKAIPGSLMQVLRGIPEDEQKTVMIADVHSDPNSPNEVLEVGTGMVDLVLVAYRTPDGRVAIGVGPVLSYYEFKQPMDSRLDDETWRNMLSADKPPARPQWVASFLAHSPARTATPTVRP